MRTGLAGSFIALTASLSVGGPQAAGQLTSYGETTRVSVGAAEPANGDSRLLDVTDDGRFVLFSSAANNLVSGPQFAWESLYLRDMKEETTSRLDLNPGIDEFAIDVNRAMISANGSVIAFESHTDILAQQSTNDKILYEFNIERAELALVARNSLNYYVRLMSISSDGRYVFWSHHLSPLVSASWYSEEPGLLEVWKKYDTLSGVHLQVLLPAVPIPPYPSVPANFEGARKVSVKAAQLVASRGDGIIVLSGVSSMLDLGKGGIGNSFGYAMRSGALSTKRVFVGKMSTKLEEDYSFTVSGTYYSFDPDSVGVISSNGRFHVGKMYFVKYPGSAEFSLMRFDFTNKTKTTLISEATGGEGVSSPLDHLQLHSVSNNGKLVLFSSANSSLHELIDETPSETEVFILDVKSLIAQSISHSSYLNGQGTFGGTAVLSSDGRYAFFDSSAKLTQSDDNSVYNIYRYDTKELAYDIVDVGQESTEANDLSRDAAISDNGRYIAFTSLASNLVVGDDNKSFDVFVHDTKESVVSRVSVNSLGEEGNSDSYCGSISADGRYVAFESFATNLVEGDDNGVSDIFIHDRKAKKTWRVSQFTDALGNIVGADGVCHDPILSPDGKYVVFTSFATNFSDGSEGGGYNSVFRQRVDPTEDSPELVSVRSDETGFTGNASSQNASISETGRYVSFSSDATDLVASDANNMRDVFVRDMVKGTTKLVSVDALDEQGNGPSDMPSISGDGRFIAFSSEATNLDLHSALPDKNGVADVFIRDTKKNKERTTRILGGLLGSDELNGESKSPEISRNGKYVAFRTVASNAGAFDVDTNSAYDVYMQKIGHVGFRVSQTTSGVEADGDSFGRIGIDAKGQRVAFESSAKNLVDFDSNDERDVFLFEIDL